MILYNVTVQIDHASHKEWFPLRVIYQFAATTDKADGAIGQFDAQATAEIGDTFWELLGYTEDPRTSLDLYLTHKADVSTTGTVAWQIAYIPY